MTNEHETVYRRYLERILIKWALSSLEAELSFDVPNYRKMTRAQRLYWVCSFAKLRLQGQMSENQEMQLTESLYPWREAIVFIMAFLGPPNSSNDVFLNESEVRLDILSKKNNLFKNEFYY